jgi:TRAP-type C4-dicarboxylate transport system permease small subunit
MNHLEKLLKSIYFFGAYASGVGVVIIGLIMFYDVSMRYAFNSPTYWADEISIYVIIWAVFLSMAWVLKTGKHIRVELVYNHFSLSGKKIADIISNLCSLIFFLIFSYASMKMVFQSFELWRTSISPLHMPMFIPHMSLVVGGILAFLQILINISDIIKSFKP